ncbi:MAG: hypothetical protein LWW94_10265 [Candidatus Desulfofervidaceae bacterium]|nr:hypothetical protein [Candidatus Desulfofervidaceae bacterium]
MKLNTIKIIQKSRPDPLFLQGHPISPINYLTPEDMLLGRAEERLKERDRKLREARAARLEQFNKFKTTLIAKPNLSNSR